MSADELQAIANAQGSGYLKTWKAQSMLMTLRDLPISDSRDRLRACVENCLAMEGFDARGVDAVTDALLAQ